MVIHVYLSILQASGCYRPNPCFLIWQNQKHDCRPYAKTSDDISTAGEMSRWRRLWTRRYWLTAFAKSYIVKFLSRKGPQMPHKFARIFWWETTAWSVFGVRLFAAWHLYSFRRKVCQPLRPAFAKSYILKALSQKSTITPICPEFSMRNA